MHFSLLFLASIVAASPQITPRAGPAAGTIITKCTEPNTIALTFDDGPWTYHSSIVKALNDAGAKATFFVTGTLYNCIYSQASILNATFAAGHQIGSHTWDHKALNTLSAADITTQMSKLETALSNILGVKPTYMRPPGGATGGQTINVLKGLGYRIVTWDTDSGDWNKETPASSEKKLTVGPHVVLMHETIPSTANTLAPWTIDWAKKNGLKMVTVAECLGDKDGAYTTAVAKTGAKSC
ncbi:related to deacetylase [Rhynchosporium agropyri]|uniref:Related to deacetylase n=1 Tax=Rhynchosporium agropyri TaxID=914238 RepID=A0A1E1LPA2_9HELO|nr:related to deacetylase [Rhynchosporium agropyri]